MILPRHVPDTDNGARQLGLNLWSVGPSKAVLLQETVRPSCGRPHRSCDTDYDMSTTEDCISPCAFPGLDP